MHLKSLLGAFFMGLLCVAWQPLFASETVITVQTARKGAPIAPTMYGLFYEDINFAADGGMYAELVKNRSFEYTPNALSGWKVMGRAELMTDGPFERNPHYLRLQGMGHPEMWTGLQNEGFFGLGLRAGADYRFSVWARVPQGKPQMLKVQLVQPSTMAEHQQLAEVKVVVDSREWKQYEAIIRSPREVEKAELRIFLADEKGNAWTGETCDVEHISLFPVDTWRGHRNGLRKDIVQALYDMRPGVFRFPGGCIVEGTTLDNRYQWKHSVGPVENRKINKNRWMDCFPHRCFPDYFQSYGMGFYELFLLSEELGAEPLPVMNVGMACQYQNWEREEAHAPATEQALDPYIQDCLDLIEFANGDSTTQWGKLRTQMGHPEPFCLKYIAVGNEQWGRFYFERLKFFVERIRKAYPDIRIVGSSGPGPDGKDFEDGWKEMTELKADLVDEHFYRPVDWFLNNMYRYDNYDRKGPKVFAGEYACHDHGKKYNHAGASIYEAAFMTTLERNADIVEMATYAPMLAHVEGWQWRPDLIWFDNLRIARSCSYHVQAMYAQNKGTHVLSCSQSEIAPKGKDGIFSSAVLDETDESFIVKVINTTNEPQPVQLKLEGTKSVGKVTTLTLDCSQYEGENTLGNPNAIVPRGNYLTAQGNTVRHTLGAKCFVVYRIAKSDKK